MSAGCVLVYQLHDPQNLKLEPEWQVVNSSGQWNLMGEVSRLLVASPGLRLMETFFLNLFSSLIGIDVPYLLY